MCDYIFELSDRPRRFNGYFEVGRGYGLAHSLSISSITSDLVKNSKLTLRKSSKKWVFEAE